MFTSTQHVKDILVAIHSVRTRTRDAMVAGNMPEVWELMADLLALEVCLVVETEKLMVEIESAAA